VIKGCLQSIREIFKEEEHRLVNNIPEGEYWTSAEPMIREIFLNLLDNAMRYGNHLPVVMEMGPSEDGEMWHFKIIDEGKGIPDDKKEYLFVRFERLNKEKKVKGSGLGLSIVRALAIRYKGRVWVEDRVPGVYTKGSIFNVMLPRIPPPRRD
jgi:signal transduction histidine kinase